MKSSTIKHALWAALSLCSALTVSANTLVTFQVDMSEQAATNGFNSATQTISVHGSFNGWGAFPLTNNPASTNPNLWTGTYNVPTNGIVMEYKCVIDPNGTWENIPKGHNRLLLLPTASGASISTPKVFFADYTSAPIVVDVTFQVDLAQQINVGAFDTNLSAIFPKGTFNNWGTWWTMTNVPTILRTNQMGLVTSNVYANVYQVSGAPGQTMDYKFYIDTGNNYESPAAGTGDPSDYNNRFFNLTDSGTTQTLPLVFFGDQPYSTVVTNLVTFQVDMSAQVLNGNFNPLIGTVELRGDFNGWGGTQILCTNNPAAANTNIYTAVVSVSNGAGAVEGYKFWASVPDNSGWETSPNRTFTLQKVTSQVMPVVYFSNIDPRDLLAADTLVTFSVIMSNAATYPAGVAFASTNSVYFNGSCLTNGWYSTWGSLWPETQLFDDGTHGDLVSGDKIYTFQYLVPKGKTLRVQYKYGIDSNDNEAMSGQDHVRYIRSTGTFVMPRDTFGNQFQEPQYGGPIIARPSGGRAAISWLGYPGVQLAITDKISGTWTNLTATDGLSSTNYPIGAGTLFFKLVKP